MNSFTIELEVGNTLDSLPIHSGCNIDWKTTYKCIVGEIFIKTPVQSALGIQRFSNTTHHSFISHGCISKQIMKPRTSTKVNANNTVAKICLFDCPQRLFLALG